MVRGESESNETLVKEYYSSKSDYPSRKGHTCVIYFKNAAKRLQPGELSALFAEAHKDFPDLKDAEIAPMYFAQPGSPESVQTIAKGQFFSRGALYRALPPINGIQFHANHKPPALYRDLGPLEFLQG
jgi:hypothetical protein